MAKGLKLTQILEEEFSSYLSKMASEAQKAILTNYKNEEDVTGNSFMGLEDSTAKQRRSQGYGGYHKILQRTKNLIKNLKVTPDFNTKNYNIELPDDVFAYAKHLNDGIESKSGTKSWNILDFPDDFKSGGSKGGDIFEEFSGRLEERIVNAIRTSGEE